MNCDAIAAVPQSKGLISAGRVEFMPLFGGVSSEIYVVQDGPRRFVVKKALPQLKVSQTWLADVSRNRVEQLFMEYVNRFLPDAVLSSLEHSRVATGRQRGAGNPERREGHGGA